MKSKRWRTGWAKCLRQPLGYLLLCLTAAAGCGRQSGESGQGAQAPAKAAEPAAAVSVSKPERQTVRQSVGQPGHIEAFEETPLYARIPGYIRKVHVDIGDEIKGPAEEKSDGKAAAQGGDLLAELSVPETVAELEKQKALAAKAAEESKQ